MNELELIKVFKLLETIEKSEQPDLEKIPILIAYAEQIYSSIKLDEHEKVRANCWNESDNIWDIKMVSPEQAATNAQKAFRAYEEQKALENMESAYNFYKAKYEKLMQINRPFFEYTLDILKKVNKHITVIIKSDEMVEEMKSLRDLVKKQEQDNVLLKEKNSKLETALHSVQDRLEKQLYNSSSYKDWIDLISTRDFIRNDIEVRVLAHIMVNDETTRSAIATKCNMAYPQVTNIILSLISRGMITEKKRGRQSFISLNNDYLERGKLEIEKKHRGIKHDMIEESNKMEEKKEQELLSDGEKDDTIGENRVNEQDS